MSFYLSQYIYRHLVRIFSFAYRTAFTKNMTMSLAQACLGPNNTYIFTSLTPKTHIRRVREKRSAHMSTRCGSHISHNSPVNCTHDSFSKMNGSLTLMNTNVINIVTFPRQSVTNVHIILICSGITNTDVRTTRLGSEPRTTAPTLDHITHGSQFIGVP